MNARNARISRKILIIGVPGPIVIGQGCEFDYSGAQACKVLRQEGYKVILVNSNPATIMTDPEMADRTYIEPITPEVVERIIARKNAPDSLLPTLGGQNRSSNTAVALAEKRHAEKIQRADARGQFCDRLSGPKNATASRKIIQDLGLEVPKKRLCPTLGPKRKRCLAHDWFSRRLFDPHTRSVAWAENVAYNSEEYEEYVRWGTADVAPRARYSSKNPWSAGRNTSWK